MMVRKVIRILAILALLGSVVLGGLATYIWLAPSDEQKLYEEKYREAREKLQKAEAARGTAAEARLAKEAKEASDSATAWGRGSREREGWNRLGVLASGGVAGLSLVILLLTFVKRKKPAAIAPANGWRHPHSNYGGHPGVENRPPPRP